MPCSLPRDHLLAAFDQCEYVDWNEVRESRIVASGNTFEDKVALVDSLYSLEMAQVEERRTDKYLRSMQSYTQTLQVILQGELIEKEEVVRHASPFEDVHHSVTRGTHYNRGLCCLLRTDLFKTHTSLAHLLYCVSEVSRGTRVPVRLLIKNEFVTASP